MTPGCGFATRHPTPSELTYFLSLSTAQYYAFLARCEDLNAQEQALLQLSREHMEGIAAVEQQLSAARALQAKHPKK